MTHYQFDQWKTAYFAAFPNAESWLARQGDDEKQSAILGMWFRTLEPLTLEEADAVTLQMNRGELEPVSKWNEQETARLVFRYAHENRRGYSAPPAVAYVPEEEFRGAPLFKALGKSMREGAAFGECLSTMRAGMPMTRSDRQPRYKCLECLDTGLVEVWAPEAMRAAKHGYFGRPNTMRTAVVSCRCFAGDRYAAQKIGRTEKPYMQTFDPGKWLPCRSSDIGLLCPSRQERIDELHRFMEGYGVKEFDPNDWAPTQAEF